MVQCIQHYLHWLAEEQIKKRVLVSNECIMNEDTNPIFQ